MTEIIPPPPRDLNDPNWRASTAIADAMVAEEARLRAEYPGKPDSWYSYTASHSVQLSRQRRRVLWNPLTWF